MITKMIYHSCESVCQHFDLKSDKHLISPHNTTPGLNIKITRIRNDYQPKNLLIVKQILLVSTLGNV